MGWCLTQYRLSRALWLSSIDSSCWEEESRYYLSAISVSKSFWEDKDGLLVVSSSVFLFFSGGRAEGSLTVPTLSLPNLLIGNFGLACGLICLGIEMIDSVFGSMTKDRDCGCTIPWSALSPTWGSPETESEPEPEIEIWGNTWRGVDTPTCVDWSTGGWGTGWTCWACMTGRCI